jgi:hypothetical protein
VSIREKEAMNTQLNAVIAQEHIQDLRGAAERARIGRSARPRRRHARPAAARALGAMPPARIAARFARATVGASH